MDEQKAINQSSFCYSVGLLQMLLSMQLITEEEYNKIVKISAEHYDADFLLCLN